MSSSLRIDTKIQRESEEIAYVVDSSNWGTSPSGVLVSAVVWDGSTWSDVSANILEGSASVDGNEITTPVVKNLVAGKAYRIMILFSAGGMVYEPFLEIHVEE